jgi:hypothetical protein
MQHSLAATFRYFRPGSLVLIAFILLVCSSRGLAQCSAPANAIVAENCLTGTDSSQWDITLTGDGGDPTIQGFSTDISVNVGGTVYFKISTPASAYTIDIYRMGYYGGLGARKITSIIPSASLPQTQPACLGDTTIGLMDCGNWSVSASWTVPTTAVSGIYFAHLIRKDTGGDSHIVFVVRNDASHSDILYQTSDTTWQAYNYYGNGSLYGPGTPEFGLSVRSFAVSYNRPSFTRGFNDEAATWVFGAEFAMVQWLEQNGYDVSYSSGVDTVRNGALIKNHKVFMDSGHDEYTSPEQRTNIQAARDAGVNLAFFSGNTMFWKTRWTNSIDGTNTPYRTMVCYKETLAFAKLDPLDPPTWTGTWRDPTFSPPADGGNPENALLGTLFMVNGPGTDNDGSLTIKVPAADGKMRFWRNTAVASLAAGATYTLVPGSLGYEWDVDADNGYRPAGAFRLSTTTYNLTTDLLLDYGGTYGAGTATHHLMMYRAPSGALVFSAGSVDWAYGLNSNHDNPFNFNTPDPDINMQQATVNLFADMGAQPASIATGLFAASKSTDVIPPHSTILSPAVGANLNTGTAVIVSGTATDTAGVVAGVEVSGDNGVTWHPANGRGTWTYSWTPTATGTTTLLSRAVDDSGNIETPSNGVILNVAPQNCPCTIFGSSTPTNPDSGDGNAVELGVKFRADSDGSIVGVRFFKSAANVGQHIGHVWTDSGQLLGTATFSSESASGWQQVNFTTPIPATANTTYLVSYLAPAGHYSADAFYFQTAGVDNPPLHALANGADGGNGLYVYGSSGGFPVSTLSATNYWVDVVYTSSNTYSISGNISGPGGAGATVSLTGPESLSTASDASGNYSFDGVVNGAYNVTVSNPGVSFAPPSQQVTVSFDGVTGVNFVATVTNPLSISGNIAGGAGATVNLAGPVNMTTTADNSGNYAFNGLLSGSYTVTPSEATFIFMPSTQAITLSGTSVSGINFQGQVCTCISIWQPTDTPAIIDSGDGTAAELGVRFTADSPAYLTGLRFYKASTNTGTHVGHLWSSTGQLLATATFPAETASGWQQGYFSSPVLVNAGTPYVASYFAPNGHYSASSQYFTSGVDRPPLHALADGVGGSNGIYIYTTTGAFPTNTFNSTNYWVDILYAAQPHNISGTISGTGGAGATVVLSGTSSATTTADASGNYTFTGVFGGSYSVTPSNPNYVFSPGIQNVTISQSDATGINFTVPPGCPCETVWQPSAHPATVDGADPQSVEIGVKIRADSDGYLLGVRFYKAAANTGVHVGNLWPNPASGTATPLATATFTNEGSSGWQQVLFAQPVPVVANTTYIASYFAPMGHYSADSAFFATAGVDSPPLHALQNGIDGQNGVFAYGTSSSFPISSFNSNNYWVDAIYANTSTYTLAGTVSGPGAAGATITLAGPINATTITDNNGNYNFANIPNGNYTVAVSQSGFVYSPSSQAVTISGAHNLAVDFSSIILGYPVSGTVAGAPGITITLSGATTQTTTTDASGNYSFLTVPNGTYTITPANPGFSIAPVSQSITVANAALTGINFTATQLFFSISGTVTGGAGTTVGLTGPSTLTTTADSSGNYSFTGLSIGTYTVTPSIGPGIVFTPGTANVVLNGANATGVNFAIPPGCPCDTIWPSSPLPALIDSGDTNAVEVGVKFRADADAYITGLRFYKSAANTGTHVGHIWTSTGTLLGTATFTNEGTSGWQQVFFASPIPITANTVYVASYFAPVGRYAADLLYFTNAGVDSPPLHALQNGVSGPNGVYLYASNGGFPTTDSQGNAVNYWVDVIYTPTTTYSIAGTLEGPGAPGATVALSGAANATSTADASGNFTFNGLANGSYVVQPSAVGFNFTPTSQTANITNGHALGLSFSSAAGVYSISGTISGPGGPAASVTLTGPSSSTMTASSNGTFSFVGLANGTYTVSVSNTGFTITPPSQTVPLNGANANLTFSSAAQTFSLTGSITGPGASGATVTLSGTSTATTTSNAAGAFSFPAVTNGNYTVTVTETGFTYTPPSQAVTINGTNAVLTFASAVQTYSLSGTITGPGGSGATVVLTGAASATTTADVTGAFAFPGLNNGSYTIAVSKTGFIYTPASQPVTINNANAVVSVSSVAPTFSITGRITGTGASGATVTATGTATASTTTNSSGNYTLTGLPAGTYTITPVKTGFAYTPASTVVTITTANGTANFTSAQAFTLSGTITGVGASGATVKLTGSTTATVTTAAGGAFSFPGLVNGTYTVAVSEAGFVYTPASQSVTINGANRNLTITSAAQTYSITGTLTGAGASGATITLSGTKAATTTSSTSGTYTLSTLPAGTYTVTPSKSGYVFTPASQSVTITTANVTANFSSTQVFTISGTISGTGGNGATVTLTGASSATVTASSTGTYSFPNLKAGSYTVTPTKAGFTFTPANRAVTITTANLVENFSSAVQTFAISGTITGAGGNGATVRLSGAATATATASTSGAYTFSAITAGSYTVTPSKSGFAYTPVAQALTVTTSNLVANFASAACTPTAIVPFLQVNGGSLQQTSSTTVLTTTATINLAPQPLTGGTWIWSGPNSYTATTRQINSIPLTIGRDSYVATYTNAAGCQSTATFTITVL